MHVITHIVTKLHKSTSKIHYAMVNYILYSIIVKFIIMLYVIIGSQRGDAWMGRGEVAICLLIIYVIHSHTEPAFQLFCFLRVAAHNKVVKGRIWNYVAF